MAMLPKDTTHRKMVRIRLGLKMFQVLNDGDIGNFEPIFVDGCGIIDKNMSQNVRTSMLNRANVYLYVRGNLLEHILCYMLVFYQ